MEKKQNIDQFPGYPYYPENEDITNAKNNNGKESFDIENVSPLPGNDTVDGQAEEYTMQQEGTDADVTEEDMQMLDAAEQNMDTTDSINLQHASLDSADNDGDPLNEDGSLDMDMTGESLDVPGSSADDDDERIGEEDEENNYYSLGGDNHEGQEESKGD